MPVILVIVGPGEKDRLGFADLHLSSSDGDIVEEMRTLLQAKQLIPGKKQTHLIQNAETGIQFVALLTCCVQLQLFWLII